MNKSFVHLVTIPIVFPNRSILFLMAITILSVMLCVNMAFGADITLQWDASTGASGYVLHYGNQSRAYDRVIDVGQSVQHTISDLQDGKSYFFAVTAYCDTDESDYSAEVVHETVANIPPTADAGTDKAVEENTLVVMDGSKSSDPDDGIKALYWEQLSGPQVQLFGRQEENCQFTAPNIEAPSETLVFQIVVEDYCGRVSTDTCTIAVANVEDDLNPDGDGDGDNGSAADTVEISKAVYKSSKDKITLIAKSDAQSSGAVLTAWAETNGERIKLGNLRFRSRWGDYRSVFRNLDQAPDRIIVSSSSGGEATSACTIR
jgi:hypothetical protein